jgi:phage terminase large subunit-like protein
MASAKNTSTKFHFDEKSADRAEGFFADMLTHVKGDFSGKAFKLEKWQRDEIVRPLFGWKQGARCPSKPCACTRRYRTAYIEVPRKNGKSTLCAGLALYLTFADKELGAEVYSAAADRDQAAIVHGVAKTMVDNCPDLAEISKTFMRSIVVEKTGSFYKVLSADAPTKHGLNAHGIIFDELHAQPNRELWDVLTTSTGARRQPLVIAITTAGFDRNSICWELHEYALKVKDGIVADDSFLPVVYAASPDDDFQDPKVWKKANPCLGVSVQPDYFRREAKKAAEMPAYENTFKRLHLNIWTQQDVRWMPMEKWDACNGEVDPDELLGAECYAGLDMASTTDIAALVLVFRRESQFYWLPFFWIPELNAIQRERRDRVPYMTWIRQGLIEVTEGDSIDQDFIRKRINELGKKYHIREIAIDRWNTAQIKTQLMGDGFEVLDFGQGFASFNGPTKSLMTQVLGHKLNHGGNPVLRWMASNVSCKTDPAGNLKPDKSKSTEKIDGIVAGLMGTARAEISQPAPKYQLLFVG